jgi:hypothetical protein
MSRQFQFADKLVTDRSTTVATVKVTVSILRCAMEIRRKIVGRTLLTALMAVFVVAGATHAQTTTPPANKSTHANKTPAAPVLEPKAIDLLKATSARLAAAHSLSFTALESYESQSRQGHPLVFANHSEVILQRPDKLRVLMLGDGPSSEFYYDGKTMTAYAPAENLIAVANAPPTIDAALEAAYHSSGTYFPFSDLIVVDPYKDMAPDLTLAYYVGQSHNVGDTTTDIVAYVEGGVFIELWIGAEDRLPRLIHAVYLKDPAQLRHNLFLSNWKLDPVVPADAFAPSAKAASAAHIPFSHPLQAAGGADPAKRKLTHAQ